MQEKPAMKAKPFRPRDSRNRNEDSLCEKDLLGKNRQRVFKIFLRRLFG